MQQQNAIAFVPESNRLLQNEVSLDISEVFFFFLLPTIGRVQFVVLNADVEHVQDMGLRDQCWNY